MIDIDFGYTGQRQARRRQAAAGNGPASRDDTSTPQGRKTNRAQSSTSSDKYPEFELPPDDLTLLNDGDNGSGSATYLHGIRTLDALIDRLGASGFETIDQLRRARSIAVALDVALDEVRRASANGDDPSEALATVQTLTTDADAIFEKLTSVVAIRGLNQNLTTQQRRDLIDRISDMDKALKSNEKTAYVGAKDYVRPPQTKSMQERVIRRGGSNPQEEHRDPVTSNQAFQEKRFTPSANPDFTHRH